MDNKEFAELVKDNLKEILDRRRIDIVPDIPNDIGDPDAEDVYKRGYKDGYMDLIDDLDNLLDCDVIQEMLDDSDCSEER